MRPIRLRFSGLRSYREPADIDFTDLDLFAVIGDTGAGKSTIIEALCLALYGRKTWSGDSLRDVIADGADAMRVELTFEAQDHRWTALRTRRRNSSAGQDRLSSETNHVPDVNGSRDVTAKVIELLGLTFDQFTRAVVMPQGRFDELLRASPTERNAILKSLLGLEDLTRAAKAAVAVRDQVRPIHDRFQAQREMLPADPAADLAAAQTDLARLDGESRRLDEAFDALAGPRSIDTAASAAAKDLRGELQRLGTAPRHLIGELEAHHRLGRDLKVQLAKAVEQSAQAETEKASAEREMVQALRGFADVESLAAAQARLGDLRRDLPDLLEGQAEAQAAVAEISGAEPAESIDPALVAAAEAASVALDRARSGQREAEARLTESRQVWAQLVEKRRGHADALETVSTARESAAAATDALTEAEAAVDTAERAVVDAEAALDHARHTNQVAAVVAHSGAGDPCPVCDRDLPADFEGPPRSDLDDLSAALAAARAARTEAAAERERLAQQAAGLNATLEAGQARLDSAAEAVTTAVKQAIAAGIDPDAPDEAVAVRPAQTALDAAIIEVEGRDEENRRASGVKVKAEAELAAARRGHADKLDSATKALDQAQQRLDRAAATLLTLPNPWIAGDVRSQVTPEDSRPEVTAVGNPSVPTQVVFTEVVGSDSAPGGRIDLAPASIDKLLSALGQARDLTDQARKAAQEAELALHAANQRQSDIKGDAAVRVTQPSRAAVATINLHLERTRALAASVLEAQGVIDADGLAQTVGADGAESTLSVDLDPLFAEVTTAGLPDVIESASAALSAAEALVETASAVLLATEAAAEQAREKTLAILHSVDSVSVEDLIGRRGRAQEAARNAETKLAAAAAAVSNVTAIDEALATVAPLRADLEVLCAALGNRQFVDHLLDRREAELLAEASRRLKSLSGDRFAFVADFGVKNTAAGEVRSPDALSGGERFQASLALALALVEIASRGVGRLDAVFVDEGFGSLDQAALEAALSTLGRVAGGGKTVALISHLRAVAEYVDTAMHVTRDDVFGSRIRTLSEDERDQLLSDDVRSGLTS